MAAKKKSPTPPDMLWVVVFDDGSFMDVRSESTAYTLAQFNRGVKGIYSYGIVSKLPMPKRSR